MNKYIFFYNGKQIEVQSDTLYNAKIKAIDIFQPKKSQKHMIHGMIVEKDGIQVTHSTSGI